MSTWCFATQKACVFSQIPHYWYAGPLFSPQFSLSLPATLTLPIQAEYPLWFGDISHLKPHSVPSTWAESCTSWYNRLRGWINRWVNASKVEVLLIIKIWWSFVFSRIVNGREIELLVSLGSHGRKISRNTKTFNLWCCPWRRSLLPNEKQRASWKFYQPLKSPLLAPRCFFPSLNSYSGSFFFVP